jgi:hypothetical protein
MKGRVRTVNISKGLLAGSGERGDQQVDRPKLLSYRWLPQETSIGKYGDRVRGVFLEMTYHLSERKGQGGFPGAGEGEEIQGRVRCKNAIQIRNDAIDISIFPSFCEELGGSSTFTIDAVKSAGAGSNQVYSQGSSQPSGGDGTENYGVRWAVHLTVPLL